MTDLGEKIQISLDECRMLVLGAQVLISLQFELAFQNAFADAPSISQKLVAFGLGLLLTFILLLWGPAYHRIAGRGQSDPSTQQFLTWSTCLASWTLSIALAVDAFISVTSSSNSSSPTTASAERPSSSSARAAPKKAEKLAREAMKQAKLPSRRKTSRNSRSRKKPKS
jgi:hypothetical protein